MDLSNYDLSGNAEAGFTLTLIDPLTAKDTDITIDVMGADSKAYRKAKAEAMREAVKNGDKELDTDDISAKVYAKCTKSWSGVVESGRDVPFSIAAAEQMYRKYYWILDQVASAVEHRLNFTKPPKKS